jgi:hypothetical protein
MWQGTCIQLVLINNRRLEIIASFSSIDCMIINNESVFLGSVSKSVPRWASPSSRVARASGSGGPPQKNLEAPRSEASPAAAVAGDGGGGGARPPKAEG